MINPLIFIALVFIGAVYLFVVSIMAFKQRGMIVALVVLNVVIFVYTYFFNYDLIVRYALSGAKVNSGNLGVMVSYMFLHANPAHLILNMLALLFFGYNLEKEFGGPLTLVVYFTSGLIAAAVHILTVQPEVLVVGGSGAIFGLMAYLTLLRPLTISPMPFLIPLPVVVASVLYVILTMPLVMSGSLSGGIAYSAHFGGLLGGTLMAFGTHRLEALKGLLIVIVIALLMILLRPFFL